MATKKSAKTGVSWPDIEFFQRFDRIDAGRQIRTLDAGLGESGGFWENVFCTGTFERTLDEKQRLLLPKSVKKTLSESASVFVTPGQSDCLELHNLESIEQRLADVTRSQTPGNRKSFSRLFFAQAEKCELDSQLRIRIPQRLLEWSKLDNRVVILGVGEHWEIWNEDKWQEYRQRHKPGFDQVAEALISQGMERERMGWCLYEPVSI